MKRKDFLKSIGTVGFGAIAISNASSDAGGGQKKGKLPPVCTLIPSETQGPYQLNLSGSSSIWRSNILESGTDGDGVGCIPLTLILNVQNLGCTPIPNMRVDFWHCNQHGYYSGFNGQNGYLGTKNYAGQTWMRGIQCTDSVGQVTFQTIYPGWYVGRVQHIHFQIYSAGTCSAGSGWSLERTSQIAFPDSTNTAVNNTAPYSAHGQNSITNSNDNVFSDGVSLQLASLAGSVGAGFVGTLNVNIDFAIVPLELVSFIGGQENGLHKLWWTTLTETSVSHFEIERSTDGRNFVNIGQLAARNTIGPNNYSFIDYATGANQAYYRLRWVDLDGSFEYTEIVVIDGRVISEIVVSPIPATDYLLLSHPKALGDYEVKVLALDGRLVARGVLPVGTDQTRLDISGLIQGAYLLALQNEVEQHVIKIYKN